MSEPAQSSNAMLIMLDTNVLLDYYLAKREGHEAAVELIGTAVQNDVSLLCAATSLKDFYYIYCLEIKRSAAKMDGDIPTLASSLAWACLDNILDIAAVASMGPGDAAMAAKLRALHEDFEDDFILATAMRCKATHIATGDKELRTHATIPALTCAELVTLMKLELAL